MKTKDLIKHLQKLVDDNEPHIHMLGEHEIMIDSFELVGNHLFKYKGFDKSISIQCSDDGVYHILNRFYTP